jgi:HSP20 family molecular chaperone IbpA
MWLICGTTLGRGKNKLLVRGVPGAEWVFCPSIKNTRRDRVGTGHCRGCRHFIRFEQACAPQMQTTRKAVSINAMTLKDSFGVVRRLGRPRATQNSSLLHHIPSLINERQSPIDVFEEENYLIILAELPCIDKKDVSVKADENSVTITAENTEKKYFEMVRLPTRINKDTTELTYRNNILQLRLKKLCKKARPRQS